MTKTYSPFFDYHCKNTGLRHLLLQSDIALTVYGELLNSRDVSYTRCCKAHGIFMPAGGREPEFTGMLMPLHLFGGHTPEKFIN